MEGDTGTDREKGSVNCNKKGVSCVDRLYSRDRREEEEWRKSGGEERRGEGRRTRQWRRQQQRLVIDIRDLALPPDPASQPASSNIELTELTESRWLPHCTAPNEPHSSLTYTV